MERRISVAWAMNARRKTGCIFPMTRSSRSSIPRQESNCRPGKIGEIVATTFNRVYPLIRFGTGDLSLLTEAPCPCGRTSPRLVKILGRVDQVTKVRGLFIHPRQVDEIASRHPPVIDRYQVVVTRKEHKDEMTLPNRAQRRSLPNRKIEERRSSGRSGM